MTTHTPTTQEQLAAIYEKYADKTLSFGCMFKFLPDTNLGGGFHERDLKRNEQWTIFDYAKPSQTYGDYGTEYDGEVVSAFGNAGFTFHNFEEHSFDWMGLKEHAKIIGHPMTLARVLLAIRNLERDIVMDLDGSFLEYDDANDDGYKYINYPNRPIWDFANDSLSDQPPEAIDFLYELLFTPSL